MKTHNARPYSGMPKDVLENMKVEQFLAEISAGNAQALHSLYSLLSPLLYGLSLRITRDPVLAEDALQEGFLRIWRSSTLFDPRKGSGMGWIITIIRNRARTAARRSARQHVEVGSPSYLEALPSEDLSGLDRVVMGEAVLRVHTCLGKLPDQTRDAIQLAFFDGLTHQELSQKLSVPLGTIKSWIRRGLAQMKTCVSGSENISLLDLLAGEHVLGALPFQVENAFERRRERDAVYCMAADWWQDQFAYVAMAIKPVTPPRRIWQSIDEAVSVARNREAISWEWWLLPAAIAGVLLFQMF